MPKSEISDAERKRRIAAGLILLPFRCCCRDRALKRDGASWSYKHRAWLLPDREVLERWIRRSGEPCGCLSEGCPFFDPEDPYDRLADRLK